MFGFLVSRMLPLVPRAVVRAVAVRYVAGEDLESALAKVREVNDRGFSATIDILGEDVTSAEQADRTVAGYLDVLSGISARNLDSNVSVKLTHLGLRLDPGGARERLSAIVSRARESDNFVRIDMEDSSVTDLTLDVYREARGRHGNVGTVLQAYLRRTREDAKRLAAEGANLRLCKGIYRESKAIAFHGREEIRRSYVETAEVLLAARGTYVGFATHDRVLVTRCLSLVERLRIPRDRFEFQALLGVPVEDMLADLVKRGFKARVYVPFGMDWYGYSTRRLKENPKLATYVVKQLFGMG